MKRTNKISFDEHADTEGTWAISYGDMVTLLLSFFVLFFSTDFDGKKKEEIESGVVALFENGEYSKKLKEKFNRDQESEVPAGLDSKKTVVKKMNSGEIVIFFPNISFFKSGKVMVSDEARAALLKIYEAYMPYSGNYKLKIEAFTDNVPVRKGHRFKDNVELSVFRSLSVMRNLEKKGIPSHRILLGGKGVFNQKLVDLINSTQEISEERKNALSRTVAFVLERES